VIQQINTSVTAKQFLRAYNGTTWTSWKRIDTLAAADSLSIASITLTGNLTVGTTSGVLSIPTGVVGTPSLTFTGDTNTGVYSTGADNLSITTNGVQRVAVGTTLTTVTTPLTVSGVVTANGGPAGSPGLTVSTGTTSLKYTEVAGILKVMPTAGNRLTVGGATSGTLGSVEVYIDSSPTIAAKAKTSGGTTTDAELLWAGYNRLGSQTTSIRTDGVPTNTSDLTTKSYVDTQVAGVTFREIMIIATTSATDGNYVVGGTVVTGVISGGTAIKLFLLGSVPTFTYASNIAASTVTWSNFSSGGRAHLVPSAGTWSVSCPAGGTGLTFTAIRTA
jgi:hypothetical protein